MIKVCHVVSSLRDNGGVQKLLYTYSKCMKGDVVFDFLVLDDATSNLSNRFVASGSKLFFVGSRKDKKRGFFKRLADRIRSLPKYDIIHIHIGYKGVIPLMMLKVFKTVNRSTPVIIHAHSAVRNESVSNRIIKALSLFLIKKMADDFYACGIAAGHYFYGKRFCARKNVFVMTNAISCKSFRFDRSIRRKMREALRIEDDCMVFGHVGTFYPPKNHFFLVDVFAKIHEANDKTCLLLIGDGDLRMSVEKKVHDLRLGDCVKFLGIKNNVADYLSVMDFFLLPSVYEGVPISLLEAQTSGLKCFVSDSVTSETDLFGEVSFISLKKSPDVWKGHVLSYQPNDFETREEFGTRFADSVYDIKNASAKLLERYSSILQQ